MEGLLRGGGVGRSRGGVLVGCSNGRGEAESVFGGDDTCTKDANLCAACSAIDPTADSATAAG